MNKTTEKGRGRPKKEPTCNIGFRVSKKHSALIYLALKRELNRTNQELGLPMVKEKAEVETPAEQIK